MSWLLTRKDMSDLTGRKRPAAIARQLSEMGIRFEFGADRWPRVLTSEVERVLYGATLSKVPEPDFEALKHWQRDHAA